ncbi:hypothetical protein AB0F72_08375 [Actinoplanes sp. NPDC023936]|uniref:hypothetical protein n=1 Tax=Actinoplanes sp. NPDC023936 TaxID=3154910 RepID=UPI0033DFE597
MNLREDVHCPACPDPETAFTLEDVGMKVAHEDLSGDSPSVHFTRPNWEVIMIQHFRIQGDTEHQRLYDLCVAELMARGLTAEQLARNDVQAMAESVRQSMENTLRRTL